MTDDENRKDEAGSKEEKTRPHLKVVAENATPSKPAPDQRMGYRYVEMYLEQLAATIIRVVRGAGKPEDIAHLANKFVGHCFEYQNKFEYLPQPEKFAESLRMKWPEYEGDSEGGARRRYIMEKTVKASLQIADCSLPCRWT